MSYIIGSIRALACCATLAVPVQAHSEVARLKLTASITANSAAASAEPEIPRLTMDNITRYYQAMTNMILLARDHPGLGEAMSIDASLSDEKNAATIAANPAAADAVRRAGLTPIQFVRLAGTLLGAMFGGESGDALPAGVMGDNMRFVKLHRAEIDAMQKKTFALAGPRPKP